MSALEDLSSVPVCFKFFSVKTLNQLFFHFNVPVGCCFPVSVHFNDV